MKQILLIKMISDQKLCFSLLLIAVQFHICTAQNSDSTSVSDLLSEGDEISVLLDDEQLTNAKDLVKFNISGLLYGEYNLSYERLIGKIGSIEFGFGLLNDYANLDLIDLFEAPSEDEEFEPGNGFVFSLEGRLYYGRDRPAGFYNSLQIKRRSWSSDNDYASLDVSIILGYQIEASKKIFFDINYGVGIRNYNEAAEQKLFPYGEPGINFVPEVNIKLSYRL